MTVQTLPMGSPEPQENGVRVLLLGSSRVEYHNHLVSIPRRQVRALLYRLAANAQPVPREVLCYLFWPEASEVDARRNLSRLVSILNHGLPLPDCLITSADQISLNEVCIYSDTRNFNQLWDTWKTNGKVGALCEAINLARGPFLDGFCLPGSAEFDTWLVTERQRWERLILAGLETLMGIEAKAQNYAGAIEFARRYLAIDELSEDVHRRLIEYHGRVGDRNAALRQYEICKMVLERDLGVDPLPETQALYQAIRQGQTIPPLQASASRPPWISPSLDTPLFGRDTAMRALDEAFERSLTGPIPVVLIAGEPGIGKTRLMQEFIVQRQNKAMVFTGSCHPETNACPYQALIEALRSQLAQNHISFVAPPPWLGEITRLLPELATNHLGASESPPSEPGWARARLFEAIDSLFAWLMRDSRQAILCLDDLHWADPVTLDWLAYKTHHQTTYPLILIGTYRSEKAGTLHEFIDRLAAKGNLVELNLQGLDQDEVGELLHHFRDEIAQKQIDADQVRQLTGGNPFFLLEMVHALAASAVRLDAQSDRDDLRVPDTIKSAVQARLRHLSAQARQVLEGAAVLGHQFDLDAIALTTGRSENETMEALEEATAHQLLWAKVELYAFKHEIVREVIYRDLSHYRRRLLHRRAGKALEMLRPTAMVALAMHFEKADQPGRAARYALEAGRVAKRVFAQVEARSWFDRSLVLLEREAATLGDSKSLDENRRARIDALNERGWALRLVGDMETYTRDLDEVSRLGELLGDLHALAHVRHRQAAAHNWFCRYSAALDAAEDGLRLSQSAGDSLLEGLCWREIGLAARAIGKYDRAEAALERSLSYFTAPEQASLRVHVLGNLSTLHVYRQDYEKAINFARQALDLCETAQLPQDRRLPLGDLGAATLARGDRECARQSLEESLRIAIQVFDSTQEILCLGHLGWLEVYEGQAQAAIHQLQKSLALAEQINSTAEQSWLHAGMAEAYHLAGQPDQARVHARQALDLAQKTGRTYDRLLAENTLRKLG